MSLYEVVKEIKPDGKFELGWLNEQPFLLSQSYVLIGHDYFGRGSSHVSGLKTRLLRERGHTVERLIGFYDIEVHDQGIRVGAKKGVRAPLSSRLIYKKVGELEIDQRHKPYLPALGWHGHRISGVALPGSEHYVNVKLVEFLGRDKVKAQLVVDRNNNQEIVLSNRGMRALVPILQDPNRRYSSSGAQWSLFGNN